MVQDHEGRAAEREHGMFMGGLELALKARDQQHSHQMDRAHFSDQQNARREQMEMGGEA